ncbi:hypothetical protein KJ763_01725 [Patescibacteria group bacterium]|nr:hypothetical protein [Patescibacteria group bacterium]
MNILPEFLIKLICVELTYFEWKEAHDKWFKAMEKVNEMEKFVNTKGFKDLAIQKICSYCIKTRNKKGAKSCLRCPLFYRNICIDKLKNKPFWNFIEEMGKTHYNSNLWQEEIFDWSKPLAYCQQVLMAINKDKPKK